MSSAEQLDEIESLMQGTLASRANRQVPATCQPGVLDKHALNLEARQYMDDFRWLSIPHFEAREARRCPPLPTCFPSDAYSQLLLSTLTLDSYSRPMSSSDVIALSLQGCL